MGSERGGGKVAKPCRAPAQPAGPECVAHEVRAPCLLSSSEQQAGAKGTRQPPARRCLLFATQGEIAADKDKARGRMPCRKAVATAAIGHSPEPVRGISRNAPELGEVPRAARMAEILEEAYQCERQQCTGSDLQARSRIQAAQHAQGPPYVECQQQDQQPCQPARSFMHHVDEEPVVAKRKPTGCSKDLRHAQILATGVPGEQARQGSECPSKSVSEMERRISRKIARAGQERHARKIGRCT